MGAADPKKEVEKEYSLAEVAKHVNEGSAWVGISGGVYDVTSFLAHHPGGKEVLLKNCGKDSTEQWHKIHKPEILKGAMKMRIGKLPESDEKKKPLSVVKPQRAQKKQ